MYWPNQYMLISIILGTIMGLILGQFAWAGIGHYKLFSNDEDRNKTAIILRFFIIIFLLVLIACNTIMLVITTHKDTTNRNVLESTEKR